MILNTLPNENFWLGFKFNKGEIKLKSVKRRCSNINLKKVNFHISHNVNKKQSD